RAEEHAPGPDSLVLGGGRRQLHRDPRRGGFPHVARRHDDPPAPRVRLVARAGRACDVGQHDAVRADRTVRRGPNGPIRRATCAVGGTDTDRDGIGAECDDDRELAAGAVVGRAGRCRHRLDLDGLRRDRRDALVRGAAWPRHRCVDRGECDRTADLPAHRRRGDRPARLALGIADRRRGGARCGAAGRAVHAKLPAGQGLNALWCDGCGRALCRACVEFRRRVRRVADRRAGAGVLAAGGELRDLRDDDERVDRHALHPGRQRPWHADHGGRRPARDHRHPRRGRHGVLRVVDRPRRPAVAAGRLLHRPRHIAAVAPRAALPTCRAEHLGVRHLLRPGLGRDRTADDRAVPQLLRHAISRRVRLGVRIPPTRRGDRRRWRGQAAGYRRQLRHGVLPGGGPVLRRRRALSQCAECAGQCGCNVGAPSERLCRWVPAALNMRCDLTKEPTLKTRASKGLGAAAGIAAIVAAVPFTINAPFASKAYADPPAETSTPVAPIPDPQGPGCDAFKTALPNWKAFADQPVGQVIASIPDSSTFNSLFSGQANPAVNIVPVLENGPYVVFAPSNAAFTAMEPGQLDAIKADPAALAKLDYYHVFLGLLGPDDIHGQRPSQEGTEVKVTGKGGDLKFNDTAKVVCGGIQADNARIYIIDAVLDPAQGPEPITPGATSSTSTTATTTTTSAP